MAQVCNLRKGVIYLPLMRRTEAGFYVGVDPVAVVNVTATEELRAALRTALAHKPLTIPTPPRDAKLSSTLAIAKVRSWPAFEREATCWLIREHNSIWKIAIQRSRKDGGGDDKDKLIVFPPGADSDEVADRALSVIQEKARERGEL
jgi:hypothetical protein